MRLAKCAWQSKKVRGNEFISLKRETRGHEIAVLRIDILPRRLALLKGDYFVQI